MYLNTCDVRGVPKYLQFFDVAMNFNIKRRKEVAGSLHVISLCKEIFFYWNSNSVS